MGNLREEVRDEQVDGKLTCARAEEISRTIPGASLAEIGEAANEEGVRISYCQLGLFGFNDFGAKRLASALPTIPKDLEGVIRDKTRDGALPCREAWRIACDEGLPKFVIGCVCETIGVRIAPCQLGCF
jgi:hypothetical protein